MHFKRYSSNFFLLTYNLFPMTTVNVLSGLFKISLTLVFPKPVYSQTSFNDIKIFSITFSPMKGSHFRSLLIIHTLSSCTSKSTVTTCFYVVIPCNTILYKNALNNFITLVDQKIFSSIIYQLDHDMTFVV